MRPGLFPLLRMALALVVGLSAGLVGAPAASAALGFRPCSGQEAFGCARLSVPLDRSGHVPGSVSLSVRRLRTGPTQSPDAVVALAGGPGQAAVPLASTLRHLLAPALAQRDLLVFDQRGTGASSPLTCPSLAQARVSMGAGVLGCAQHLGLGRGSFTTLDSVADIEAVRQASGYRRLVLVGVSYGTKVALEYAERYPQNVESLVLDSVVPTDGPDPLQRPTLGALSRVLGDLCAQGACAGVTDRPLDDLAALVGRLQQHPLTGHAYDGHGRRHPESLGRGDLLDILVSGDENPALRAELPAAVRSALSGDSAPLLRLALLAAGLVPDSAQTGATFDRLHQALSRRPLPASSTPGATVARSARAATAARSARAAAAAPSAGAGGFDPALYLATTCEELPFPWDRNAPAATRARQATAAAAALPAAAVFPFDRATALLGGPIPTCLSWPVASPAPPAAAGPPPTVPTLIVSGAADLRTPVENALGAASLIRGSEVVVVPHTGHSVLGTDLTPCSGAALRAFFAQQPVAPCPPSANPFAPIAIAPTRLSAVAAAAGVSGRAGRTLTAVQATLVDLRRQLIGAILGLNRNLPNGARFGGLRGGFAKLVGHRIVLHRYDYVPGVKLSGSVPTSVLLTARRGSARLRVGGSAADHGTVRLSGHRVSGRLGARRFSVTAARASASVGARPSAGAPWSLDPQLLSRDPQLVHVP